VRVFSSLTEIRTLVQSRTTFVLLWPLHETPRDQMAFHGYFALKTWCEYKVLVRLFEASRFGRVKGEK
jgi:hypothetical protein